MRRAIVMSVLFHLLVVVSLVELPVWPTGPGRSTRGRLPLIVVFRSGDDINQRNAVVRNQTITSEVLPVVSPVRTPPRASSVVVMRRAGQHGDRTLVERRLPNQMEVAESLASLPVELEREYRINLAREARLSPYHPAEIRAKGQAGVVRVSISYWGRPGTPSVRLEHSSGYRELDQAALKTVALAISRVPLPAGAQGARFQMPYALEYRLTD